MYIPTKFDTARAQFDVASRAYLRTQPGDPFFAERQQDYTAALANLQRAGMQEQQQAGSAAPRGLGSPQQAGQDIYGATYGAAQNTMADPRLAELAANLDSTISGQNVPYSQDRINRELTGVADMTAAAAGNQAQQTREWAASRGFNPSDPGVQARMQEIDANRQMGNQQARGDIGRQAIGANYSAQQQALAQAMSQRFSQLGLANNQNLSGANYSAQVQQPMQYVDPNAGILAAMQALNQQPQQSSVAPYTPQPQQPVQQQAPATQAPATQAPQWSGSVAVNPQQVYGPAAPQQPPQPQWNMDSALQQVMQNLPAQPISTGGPSQNPIDQQREEQLMMRRGY